MNARRVKLLTLAVLAAGVLAGAPAPGPAAGAAFTYTGSIQMSRGTYIFTQPMSGYFFINGLTFVSGPFTLTASLPLIYQTTPYVSYTGVGVLPSGGTESSVVSQRQGREPVLLPEVVEFRQYGIGDPLISAGLGLWKEGAAVPGVELTAQVKLPLADVTRGFGTGRADYSAGVSVSKRLGSFFLFANTAYWVLGDLPDLELRDAWAYGFSVGHAVSGGKLTLLASYFGYTEIIAGVAPPSSLGLGLSVKVGARSGLMLNAAFGLSESSPDLSVSLGWAIGL